MWYKNNELNIIEATKTLNAVETIILILLIILTIYLTWLIAIEITARFCYAVKKRIYNLEIEEKKRIGK